MSKTNKRKTQTNRINKNVIDQKHNNFEYSDDDTIDDSSYYSESTVNSDNEIYNMINNIPFLDHDDDNMGSLNIISGHGHGNNMNIDQDITTSFNRLSDVFNINKGISSKRRGRLRKSNNNNKGCVEEDSEYLTDDKEDVKQIIETTGGNITTLLDKLEEKEQRLEKRRLTNKLKNKQPNTTSKLKELRKCMIKEKVMLQKRMLKK